jgi:hypothetical protein
VQDVVPLAQTAQHLHVHALDWNASSTPRREWPRAGSCMGHRLVLEVVAPWLCHLKKKTGCATLPPEATRRLGQSWEISVEDGHNEAFVKLTLRNSLRSSNSNSSYSIELVTNSRWKLVVYRGKLAARARVGLAKQFPRTSAKSAISCGTPWCC